MNDILQKAPLLLGLMLTASIAQSPNSVFIEDLTWIEVRDAIDQGRTTIIVPTGGTEQNGPHMVLGKHNYLVKYKAGEIANQLGDTLVAPVVAYVPEGDIDPPTSHMRFCRYDLYSRRCFSAVCWSLRPAVSDNTVSWI